MASLWIVDRSPRRRAALARLAGSTERAVHGAPGDPRFETAPTPDVVLLALDEDWERELQFAHATGDRAAGARWILIGERGQERDALALFDTRIAEYLVYPPSAETLRSRIGARPANLAAPSLSERARRAAVSERFARWFGDLDLPDVLHALDPRLADVPVLIRGETGTGRGLVARYVHSFGGSGRGALAHVPCSEHTTAADVSSALARVRATRPGVTSLAIWLENAERLTPASQRQVLAWLEFGPPDGATVAPLVRWIATVGEAATDSLDPELRIALGGLPVALPTLRERPLAIGRIAWETARAWCAARQERPRRFGEDALAVMEEYPWPGNVRELEALVVQSLAAATSDPLRADDLQLEGIAFAPLDAGEIGTLVEESPASPEGGLDNPSVKEIDELLEGVAPTDEAEPPLTLPQESDEQCPLARLVDALSHPLRDPLVTVRTFAELLPERFDDERFRDRFAERVRDDAGRIDALGQRLAGIANLARTERDKVDVAGLLEELLEQRRQKIRDQRLLVLKELDTSEPHALCDRAQLHFALDTLLGKALEWVPTNGDVYLASRHHPGAPGEGPSVRVLVRFHDPQGGGEASQERAVIEGSLELLIAEVVVRAQGGSLSVTSTDGEETVIVIDLPAP